MSSTTFCVKFTSLVTQLKVVLQAQTLGIVFPYRWLQFNSSATYDTVAIASIQNAARVESSCRHCIFVHTHDLGTAVGRYAALPSLIESSQWKDQVAGKYDYIYFPQEEIVQTVESVNRYAWCTPLSSTLSA